MWALLVLALQAAPPATIAEIRVHGNYATPDADVIGLSGLAPGHPADERTLAAAADRLTASGRFEHVEVRRRFRSIDDPTDILVVILVDEHAAATPDDPLPGRWPRLRSSLMWLPVLDYEEGYGLSYGVRVSAVDAIGDRTRVSVPAIWGGDRRVGVEVERRFDGGPLTRLSGGVATSRRVHPHFERADRRHEVWARAERSATRWLRLGAGVRAAAVAFGGVDEDHRAAGLDVTVDTRIDPAFPRNAVFASAGWQRLWSAGDDVHRWTFDGQGYLGLPRGLVLAARARAHLADRPLPRAERPVIGGASSLRGYRAGFDAGDNVALASAELRVPLTSPLSVGRFGVTAFVDAGTAWPAGEPLGNRRFARGVGGGVYFGVAAFSAGVDLAWPADGKARVHATLGVSF
ncbi:MAG: BamA/TamA family outer membrane protein [Acidobacteriota bacterium]